MTKNPWPIALTVLIVSAFAFATYIAVTMIRQKVDLVATDTYDKDLQHEKRMGQQRRARALAQPVQVSQLTDPARLAVTLPDASATGTITLYRPSDSRLDRTEPITLNEERAHVIATGNLASGLWRIDLEWMQGGTDYFHSAQVVLP
jgi:hypothetical protein